MDELRLKRVRESISVIEKKLASCELCPKNCRVNRFETRGFCKQEIDPRVSAIVLHFGEEPPLVGIGGAGAVFFSGCSMGCVYCQNFAFSQHNSGRTVSPAKLGEAFLRIQAEGGTCLDLVTATPNLYGFLKAYEHALKQGFSLPVVYNTSGYENVEILRLLEGTVDIYLTDIRYTDNEIGFKYSAVPDYWTVAKKAVKEMFRQVGAFTSNMKGVIVRHLVLPGGMAGTDEMAQFVAFELSSSVPVSLMSQYRPVHRAKVCPELARRVTPQEYAAALDRIDAYGLTGWMQHFESEEPLRAKPLGWD